MECRGLVADLVLLDVVLGIDWLTRHLATLDCRKKVVIFRIPNDEKNFDSEAIKFNASESDL